MSGYCGHCFRGGLPVSERGHLHPHMTGCTRGECTNHAKCPHKRPCQGRTPEGAYR